MPERIAVVEDILNANDRLAAENRTRLDAAGVFALNLMASPGAGKTSIVEHTVRALSGELRIGVINGDLATSIDADRAAAAGALAVQVNTGGECHLDAVMLRGGLERLPLDKLDLLLVENVGNLICPAAFRLGTHRSVLVASVPEGADKPYKYPATYRGVDVLLINKIDLLPYVDFDLEYFRLGVEMLSPRLLTFPLSCRTGEGLDPWFDWLRSAVRGGAQQVGERQ